LKHLAAAKRYPNFSAFNIALGLEDTITKMVLKPEKYLPVHQAISTKHPTPTDILIDGKLKAYMDENMKLETSAEMDRRDHILKKVEKIFKNWVVEIGMEVLRMPEEEAKAAGGELFVSGSHKLGVREPGADIGLNMMKRINIFYKFYSQLITCSYQTPYA
jgi:poly(A) polymerase Pap1